MVLIGGGLSFLGVILFLVALISLISPLTVIGIQSRRMAAMVGAGAIVMMVTGGVVLPKPDAIPVNAAEPSDTDLEGDLLPRSDFPLLSLSIPTDPSAEYQLLDVRRVDGMPTLVKVLSRRDSRKSGTAYTWRLADCSDWTYKTLATADTLQGLAKSAPDRKMSKLAEGSISTFISVNACKTAGVLDEIDQAKPANSQPQRQQPPLALKSFDCSTEHGYHKVAGEVENVSDARIDDLMVVATYFASDGRMIKSSQAMVEYDPLLSGQSSPFSTLTREHPMVTECKVGFKTMFGGQLAYSR